MSRACNNPINKQPKKQQKQIYFRVRLLDRGPLDYERPEVLQQIALVLVLQHQFVDLLRVQGLEELHVVALEKLPFVLCADGSTDSFFFKPFSEAAAWSPGMYVANHPQQPRRQL